MTEFWIGALALTIFLYVLLDGFDLGIGMLLGAAPNERWRVRMLATISPVWDGNETWLVINAAILFGIFPLTYATLLSAFYLPVLLMLAGLILRGVSFEFRDRSLKRRRFWDGCFIVGSGVAAFVQGAAIGALVEGLPVRDGHYIGGAFGWCSPFALLCGVGLCTGYALLGAGWLAYRGSQEVRAFAFRIIPWLLLGVLTFLAIAFVSALLLDLKVMMRWQERPGLYVFPLVGVGACAAMLLAVRQRRTLTPFLCGILIFAAAFGTLAASFYPYMIPFSVTVAQAAAPRSSQAFLFWGAGLFILPLTLIYTAVVYSIFRGKVVSSDEEYSA
jgi:cytochrome bd ubiquinol oxidase subunit II